MKTHRTTKEEMEGPISFWGYKKQESNLILPEHDDDEITPVLIYFFLIEGCNLVYVLCLIIFL